MFELNFDQRTVLTLYKVFFGIEYPTSECQENRTDVHVEAQKMCYLLKLRGVSVGDFYYTWNHRGPFSPGLLVLLRSLDENHQNVQDYYSSANSRSSSKLSDMTLKAQKLSGDLQLNEHKADRLRWIELLGSLAFLSNSVLPGAPFDLINERLRIKKPQYDNDGENRYAWNILCDTKLIVPTR